MFTLAPAHRHWPLLVSKLAKHFGNTNILKRYGICCIKHCAAKSQNPKQSQVALGTLLPLLSGLPRAPHFSRHCKAHSCALQTGFGNLSPGHADWQNACHAQMACSFLRVPPENIASPAPKSALAKCCSSAVGRSRLSVLHWLYLKLSGKTGLKIISLLQTGAYASSTDKNRPR